MTPAPAARIGTRTAALLFVAAPASYLAGFWALATLHARVPALRPFMLGDVLASDRASWITAALTPLGGIAIIAV